ncbi:MAG: HAMP domain-containing histidine kinase [Planctomycetes bacterium]|nr:HAMP domain-containing histidine kinase [Planctomycetota bacterium]
MKHGPLERRLRRATLALASLLAATFAVLLPQVAFKTEDAVFQRQMAHMLAVLAADPVATLAPGMRRLQAADPMPRALREHIARLSPGVHELNDIVLDATATADETDVFVGIATSAGDRVELLYDVRPFEAFDEAIAAPGYDLVIVAGIVLALLGAAVIWWQLQHVFSSLRRLAPLLQTAAPQAQQRLSTDFGDDELGSLARELLVSRDHLAAALARERRFTREASHELRTPVAIIAGALELLRRDGALAPTADGLVARIGAANQRIEALIGAFLWLARDPARAEELQRVTTLPLLQRVLSDLRRAGDDADVVAVVVVEDLPFEGEPLCAEVVLRNLVDNALRHRGTGPVQIRVENGVRIENSLPPASASPHRSHGLGLGITRDLCARFGWQLDTRVQADRYIATLHFSDARN